jgi:signal recognition particle receptor subunit beta
MAFVNEATGDLHFKVLYIGSQSSGKTTNLQALFLDAYKDVNKKENEFLLESIPRNPFFDFLPLSYGTLAERNARIHLYTLPAHQLWPSVNISLMMGVDGIVNVIDRRVRFLDKNRAQVLYVKKLMESLQIQYNNIPFVYQFNHTDAADALAIETLKNNYCIPDDDCIESIATRGIGVLATFSKIAEKIIAKVK